MNLRGKKISLVLAFLACQVLWAVLVEGKECDCSFFEQSLNDADERFQRIKESRETDSEILFLECLDKTASRPDTLYNYCLNFAAMKDRPQAQEVHDKAKKKIQTTLDDCQKVGKGCGEWKKKLSDACEELTGKQRARCYLGKNAWDDFQEKYPREAEDFLKAWKGDVAKIKDFLYAKANVCDQKYQEDLPRKARCIANFKEKYAIQDLMKKADEAEKGGEEKEEKKDLNTLIVGKWDSIEAKSLLEITLEKGSHKINCIAGCGEGEEFEWSTGFNFSRKFSRTTKLGVGYFSEKCIFDKNHENHEKFVCDGTVKFMNKYGGVDVQRLDTRNYNKLLEFKNN